MQDRSDEPVDIGARFDARAGTYDGSDAHRWQAERAAELVTATSDERVLDVATGTGLLLRSLPHPATRAHGVGVDIATGLLAVARRALPRACWIQADAGRLPIADQSVDVLTCVAGISYLQPAAVLPEWRRVLRRGGRLLITLPADHGLTAFTLLQEAAGDVGITLPEPNAGLGHASKLAQVATGHGFNLRSAIEHTYTEPLTGDPDDVFHHYLQQGLAEPLRHADAAARQQAMHAYRHSYRRSAERGHGAQRLLFASFNPSD